MMSIASMGSNGRPSTDEGDECEATKTAISSYLEREEEIERKKMEVKERVESQLNRAEEETRRLAQVWEELEVLTDPMRKEVGAVRKKIDLANRDLKSLAQICHKKEKEYKEAMEAFKEKNNEKAQLTNTLVELVSQSEKIRMRKLEELSKIVSSNT
ncbi:reticulocyte-binding protein homolog 2a-like [Salvia hispanica]|uniref:reticulocyte-binding protein homolog 2a-like n=1 Tax=Salvia hispanica TaxID=49212 RepID=UPI0020094EA9|nr:reticulocyte-binding protein homolog 2a-like [Salvia hispanica]